MTLEELSAEFEILYNNIMSNSAPGLDEYEKSVFLTTAQEELIKNYFNPKGNKYQEGFTGSAKREADFAGLIVTDRLDSIAEKDKETSLLQSDAATHHLYKYNKNDRLAILNETYILRGRAYPVIHLNPVELTTLLSSPYPYPPKNVVYGFIDSSSSTQHHYLDIITPMDTGIVRQRFLKVPEPIILPGINDIANNLRIRGRLCDSDGNKWSVPNHLVPEVLQRAVELAKAAYSTSELSTAIQIGSRSE